MGVGSRSFACVLLLHIIFLLCSFSCLLAEDGYFTNPIINGNDPDPGAIYLSHEAKWYIATTTVNQTLGLMPIHSSTNKVDWKFEGYIFPKGHDPKWANKSFWAPEFHIVGDDYLVCYVGRTLDGTLSVGVAWSKKITGPYTDLGSPLIYNKTMGSIDPTIYYDETTGNRYLFWKDDGNAIGQPTNIYATLLYGDGHTVDEHNRTFIITNDPSSWEGSVTEAPWVYYRDGTYTLFYSGNAYASTKYAIGVAQAKNILGPYTKYENNPILKSNSKWTGPGHCSVIDDPDHENKTIMFYAAWYKNEVGIGHQRRLMMDPVWWHADGWPYIDGNTPSIGKTPIP